MTNLLHLYWWSCYECSVYFCMKCYLKHALAYLSKQLPYLIKYDKYHLKKNLATKNDLHECELSVYTLTLTYIDIYLQREMYHCLCR